MELPPTFIQKILNEREIIIIKNGVLYTASYSKKPRSGPRYLRDGIRYYQLEEGTDLNAIEHAYFTKIHVTLEELFENLPNAPIYGPMIKQLGINPNAKDPRSNGLEEQLCESVWKHYQSLSTKGTVSAETTRCIEQKTALDSGRFVSFLGSNLEERMLKSGAPHGIVFKDCSVFQLHPAEVWNPKTGTSIEVGINSERYFAEYKESTIEFEQRYRKELLSYTQYVLMSEYVLRSEAEKPSNQFLFNVWNSQKQNVGYTDPRCGTLRIQKGMNAQTIFALELPAYMICVDHETYLFPQVTIGLAVDMGSQTVSMKEAPVVYKPQSYHHPFVFQDNKICYNTKERWKMLGITFGDYQIKELAQKKIPEQLALLLYEARRVLTSGYFGKNLFPVAPLSKDRFPKEQISKQDASTLRTQGIQLYDGGTCAYVI